MPSSLTKVLPFALVFSTYLPVSVWGTGGVFYQNDAFLVSECRSLLPLRDDFAVMNRLSPQSTQWLTFPQASSSHPYTGTGILTGCPSPTPLGLGLGPTNPTWTDLPSETLDFRRTWFSHVLRYSCRHSHSRQLQQPLQAAFAVAGTLPYHSLSTIPSFGGMF